MDLNIFDHTPQQLHALYNHGFKGVVQDSYGDALFGSHAYDFYHDYPQAQDAGAGKLICPYKFALMFEPTFGAWERQTTGDCVSHAIRNAGQIHYSFDAFRGLTTYEGRFATENIYGYRGHNGQGASCSRLSNYVSTAGPGGFLIRKVYPEADLSVYKSSIGHNWGSRGTPASLNALGNKALHVYKITSPEQARDALALGFGIARCSGLGFDSRRNEDGLSEQKGRWAHAESWIGSDDTEPMRRKYNGILFLEQNSWGPWNSGPKRHEQPDGSYYIRPSVSLSMIRGGQVFAIGTVQGYNREIIYGGVNDIVNLSSRPVAELRQRYVQSHASIYNHTAV